jgi:hypothetical protein
MHVCIEHAEKSKFSQVKYTCFLQLPGPAENEAYQLRIYHFSILQNLS